MGLIGGSIGMASCKQRLAEKVVGIVRRESAIDEVKEHYAADNVTMDIEEGVSDADHVIIATPISAIEELTSRAKPALKKECIFSDVASVKATIVDRLESILRSTCFYVGVHPMAGSEKQGIAIADAGLFKNAICIITPTENSDKNAIDRVAEFWQRLGSIVRYLSPRDHDEKIAMVSHLPHIAASAVINALSSNSKEPIETIGFAGPAFKDVTRISASSPDMWVEICMANRDAVLRAVKSYNLEIANFIEMLQNRDAKGLRKLFQKAKDLKEASSR